MEYSQPAHMPMMRAFSHVNSLPIPPAYKTLLVKYLYYPFHYGNFFPHVKEKRYGLLFKPEKWTDFTSQMRGMTLFIPSL
jgi:hypothetical protein